MKEGADEGQTFTPRAVPMRGKHLHQELRVGFVSVQFCQCWSSAAELWLFEFVSQGILPHSFECTIMCVCVCVNFIKSTFL